MVKRKIIEIDEELCDGCGNCVVACEEGAIKIIDGKAKVIKDMFCDGLGACIGDCPLDALKIIEREADAFDEEAVKVHLATVDEVDAPVAEPQACGCASQKIQTFIPAMPATSCQAANKPKTMERTDSAPVGRAVSALANWPIQINLVPPQAPFLKGSDLLLAADCVPASVPNFHQDFLQGKTMLLGCPKLDDAEEYVQKFAAILQTADIKSLTIVIMEVPCCSGMPMIIKKAMEISGVTVPVEEIVVSIKDGSVLQRLQN